MLLSRINDSRQNFAQFPIKLFHIHGLPNETILSIVWQSVVLKANISAGPLCKLNVTITKPPRQQNTPNYKTLNVDKKSTFYVKKDSYVRIFFKKIRNFSVEILHSLFSGVSRKHGNTAVSLYSSTMKEHRRLYQYNEATGDFNFYL